MPIRPATTQDLEAIRAILNHEILHSTAVYEESPWSLEKTRAWFDARLAQSFPVCVFEEDGDILGYGSYGTFRARMGYRFTVEHSVYVHSDAQGKGIGSQLLQHLIQQATENGYHAMIAGVDTQNAGSVAFHEKHGFVQVGTFEEVGFKFGKWVSVCFLQRKLIP